MKRLMVVFGLIVFFGVISSSLATTRKTYLKRQLDSELYIAIRENDIQKIKELVSKGADPDSWIGTGYSEFAWTNTPLFWAIVTKNTEVVKLLVELGADVNKSTPKHGSPLARAILITGTGAHEKDFSIIMFLIENGADVNSKDHRGNTCLHLISPFLDKDIDLIKFLISKGADVNAVNDKGETPLHTAVTTAVCVKKIKILLDAGADVNAKDLQGCTPLHRASAWSSFDTLDKIIVLIDAGADVNAGDLEWHTPLHHVALGNGYTKIAEVLIKKEVDVNAKASGKGIIEDTGYIYFKPETKFRSLYFYPVRPRFYDLESMKELFFPDKIKVGKAYKITITEGWTPLHYAVARKHKKLIAFLIESGADPEIKDAKGRNCLDIATETNDTEIQDLLKSRN